MSIAIRTAIAADLPALAELFDQYRRFYEQPADLPLAHRFLAERMSRGESVILLAESEAQQALGFCQLYPTFCSVEARPIYALYDLYVLPAQRRSGAGTALLKAAEQLARREGKARMDLTTARDNLRAQSLYESLGWVRDEVFLAYNRAIKA
ncbi:GNAT family N-acetyltransferase [Paucibacter sp. APW11]|uniref:GNAT family N-acetyltransferase n=1 Tax=Roseateles aquae TaxID=3077235 RepID=A0ABU3PE67_9BURK|nr:GNAT family N-acetyltransferase [Paucibacter sp. APW11]MDT9000849.1 GNAT family N-acetyltransferase [Paucibacter sp. APW11]